MIGAPRRWRFVSAPVFDEAAQRLIAGWSSPVARQAHNLKVIGSNPIPATKLPSDLKRTVKSRPSGRLSFLGHVATARCDLKPPVSLADTHEIGPVISVCLIRISATDSPADSQAFRCPKANTYATIRRREIQTLGGGCLEATSSVALHSTPRPPVKNNASKSVSDFYAAASGRTPTSVALGFVLFSQVAFLGFAFYNYVVFFETDKIVLGFVAILSAVVALGGALAKFLPANSSLLLQNYMYLLLKHLRLLVLITCFVWLICVGWTYRMSNDLVGRLVYVKHLQESLSRGTLDLISMPDPELLASAFSRFPDRREVPFLLGRSSRLLFQAGRADLFRAVQRAFLEKLDLGEIVHRLCETKKTHPKHDSLSFLIAITGEAYSPNEKLQGEEKTKDSGEVLNSYVGIHDLVARCPELTLETKFELIKLKDVINDLRAELGLQAAYDVDAELEKFELEISGTHLDKILDFWQSHGAQEYLDFSAYRLIDRTNSAVQAGSGTQTADSVDKIIKLYETLLLVRQSGLRSGEIQWSAPPQRLTLFYAFMLDARLSTLVWPDVASLFQSNSQIKNSVAELTNRKAFEQFRTPNGWFAGTPLDYTLNGSATLEKINSWLKIDW